MVFNGLMESYDVVDLFAGTGAFSYAFSSISNSCKCVFANDMEKASQQAFDLNHPEVKLTLGDLNNISEAEIPSHHILCAGFPCQPFSIAGQQKGFEDERANVFWKIVKILRQHAPEVVILENVKNLKTHDKGKTFKVITDNLVDCGYHFKHAILDTSIYTQVPQHRERIYIVGFRDPERCQHFNFDLPEMANQPITDFLEQEVAQKYYYTDKLEVWEAVQNGVTQHIRENVLYQYRRTFVRENKTHRCPTLTANMGGGGHNVPLLRDDKGIRKLTPRECFNLQGFPSTYQLPPLCDSALYKLAGNAVSVPIVKLLAERIIGN